MILDIKEFTNAVNKITSLIGRDKTVVGVMLVPYEDTLEVCYSTGSKVFIERIGIEVEEGDLVGEHIAVDYGRLVDIMKVCQSSGSIVTDKMAVSFSGNNVLEIEVDKKLAVLDDEESEPYYETVSTFRQSLAWKKAGSDTRSAILVRSNYDRIFESEEYDEWNTLELQRVMTMLSTEKSKVVYALSKKQVAFVANTAYLSVINLEYPMRYPLILVTDLAQSVADILGKSKDKYETVRISVMNNKFCNIYTEDESFGICITMNNPVRGHLNSLDIYSSKEYQSYQITFIREVLKNVVESALDSDKSEKTVLKFEVTDGINRVVDMVISSKNSNASINNSYKVKVVEDLSLDGDNIENLELGVSLKVLNEILGKCRSPYVTLDIDIDENNVTCVRIGEVNMEKRVEVEEEIRDDEGLDIDEVIPLDILMKNRDKIFDSVHYFISNK